MPWPSQTVLSLLTAVAALYDLRFRRIPNWLTGTALVTAFLLNGLLFGVPGLQSSALGFLAATLVYLPLWLLRALGAGDVKLMMAVGALAGPVVWLHIFLITGILGGAIALALLLWRGQLFPTLIRSSLILRNLFTLRAPWQANSTLDVRHPASLKLPHGVTVAAGTVVYLVLNAA